MLPTVSVSTSQFEPQGYCPKCDYHTDVGLCPECGYDIKPRRLRRRPRSRTAKYVRRVLLAVILSYGIIWFAFKQAKLAPYFPTAYLLAIQTGQGPLASAAQAELANRMTAKRLSAKQTERFVKQWADIRWFASELYRAADESHSPFHKSWTVIGNRYFARGFPNATLPAFAFDEHVRGIRVNSRRLPTGEWMLAGMFGSQLGGPTREALTSAQGFYPNVLLLIDEMKLRSEPSDNVDAHKPLQVIVETTVTVSELGTNKVFASWPMTHSVEIVPPRSVHATWIISPSSSGFFPTLPGGRQRKDEYQQGVEDLMFPYGRMPGEFSPAEIIEDTPRPLPGDPN